MGIGTVTSRLAVLGVLGIIVAQAAPASAEDRKEAVRFEKGTSGAKIESSIKGDAGVVYSLRAKEGQVLSVHFRAKNASCYFNVLPPASEEAIHIGSVAGDDFTGTLAASGAYRTVVYLMRNAARRNETCKFTIAFEVKAG